MSSPTLSFDGTDDYVQTTFGANYGTTGFSVGGWWNPTDTSGNVLAHAYDGTGWVLDDDNGSGHYRLYTTNNNTVTGGTLRTDEWHHFFGQRYDDGTLEIYINGDLITSSSSDTDVSNTADVVLGQRGQYYLDGGLDDVRVFPYALEQYQIRNIVNGQIHGGEDALWSMNEGTGTTLTDATDNNYTGTIYGASWSTRSDGNTYDWESGDWGSPQAHDDVNTNYGEVIIGQNLTHLMDSTEEARYIMDGNTSESQLHDGSGNGNHSTTVNNINFTGEPNTRFRGAYRFNGTDSYVELPSTIQSSGTTIATELWFYPRSTGSQILFDSGDFYTIFYDRYGNGRMNIGVFGDNFTPTNVPPLNTWNHLNMYWDVGNEIGVSINGDPWETYATSETVDNQSNPRYLGSSSNSFYFDGRMTEIRFVAGQQIPIDESLYQINGTLTTGRKT